MGTKGRKPRASGEGSNVRLYMYGTSLGCEQGRVGFVLVIPGVGLILQLGKKQYITLGMGKIDQFLTTTGVWEVTLVKDSINVAYKSGRFTFTIDDKRYCCNASTLKERIRRTFPEYVQHVPQTI